MSKSHPTCNRAGIYTERCARPAAFRMTVKVAQFVVILWACVDCHAKAPASLGMWESLKQ